MRSLNFGNGEWAEIYSKFRGKTCRPRGLLFRLNSLCGGEEGE